MSKNVTTRFAPSPTGMMHIGSLRTALYSYLLARHNGGKFVLRVEDTDKERSKFGALENFLKTLHWAGLEYDEGPIFADGKINHKGENGPYIQSERTEIYREHAEKLVKSGHAYYCFCTKEDLDKMRKEQENRGAAPMYDRRCLKLTRERIKENLAKKIPHVVRLRMPREGVTVFKDIVRGRISFENKNIDDQVLLKSDGFPTYHLAVVVDDHLMKVSHIIRGEEWLSSTPKHVVLYDAFGWRMPEVAHLPLIIDKSGKKLSKRYGDVSVESFIKKGYLREALLNFIAFLGWNPKDEREIFPIDELVKEFDLKNVNKSAAVFDMDRLDWINGKYIREMSIEDLIEKASPYLKNFAKDFSKDYIAKAIELEKTRVKKLSDLPEMLDFFFKKNLDYDVKKLIWKKADKEETVSALQKGIEKLESINEKDFTKEKLEEIMLNFAKKNGIGNGTIFWSMRYAMSGKEKSPSPFEIMGVLGKEESLMRIQKGLDDLRR
ncbi:MAG: hypothetical protein ACD_63C00064G0002 [uncultured bacterium]|nr:MAG: hypothetical protein ACD_63C00064G0002 [uncultured bacterium]